MAELSDIFRGISSGRFPGRELNERSPGISPFLNRFPEEVLNRRDPGIPPFLNRFNTTQSIETQDAVAGARDAAIEATNLADQNVNGMGYDYSNEGYTDFTPMGHDYTNEGYAAGWQTPSAAIGGVAGPGDFAGENRDLLRLGQARAPVRQRPTAHPSMAGILPTFGMKRPGTSFDASIEVGGSPGGWFTPEEYGRNYYKFGRGA